MNTDLPTPGPHLYVVSFLGDESVREPAGDDRVADVHGDDVTGTVLHWDASVVQRVTKLLHIFLWSGGRGRVGDGARAVMG